LVGVRAPESNGRASGGLQGADREAARAKWKRYLAAYETALVATSSAHAPWYVIPADSKSNRNLMIAALVERTLREMKLKAPKPDFDPAAVKIV
jgi:hypothetical protein